MANLKFADIHNMVAFLFKPKESDGFEQIADFLNAQPIRYALTVNPTIYTLCIEQFWSTVKDKTINGEVQLHALVDATNQKFNLSKYIFESIVRNLDNLSGKFLMYPRFVQVFLDQQLEGRPTYKRIYDAPSHMKKIFGNMRRVGKGFSRRVTPLFPTMVVQNQQELGEGSAIPTDPYHRPTITQPSTSQPQKTKNPRKPKRKDTQVPQPSGPTNIVVDEAVHKELGDSLVRAATTASSLEADSASGPMCQETTRDTIAQTRFENVSKLSNDLLLARGNTLCSNEDSLKLKELMELCTNLQTRVLDLDKTKTTQAEEIVSLKRKVKKLEQKKRSRTHEQKRLHKVGMSRRVESSRDEEDLVNVQDDADAKMFDVDTLNDEEVFVAEQEVAAKDVNLTIDEVTLAQALAALKSVKPKVKGDVIKELSVPVSAASAPTKVSAATTTTATILTPRKGIIITELDTLNDKEVFFAEQEVAAKDVNLTVDEVTLAQALVALKSIKPPSAATTTTVTIPTLRKGIVITELGTPTITRSSQQPSYAEV
ncbi:hypothetical protein Tco_0520508 [Tanacetum coccineum]